MAGFIVIPAHYSAGTCPLGTLGHLEVTGVLAGTEDTAVTSQNSAVEAGALDGAGVQAVLDDTAVVVGAGDTAAHSGLEDIDLSNLNNIDICFASGNFNIYLFKDFDGNCAIIVIALFMSGDHICSHLCSGENTIND